MTITMLADSGVSDVSAFTVGHGCVTKVDCDKQLILWALVIIEDY